jgi:murein DD-endopeptidase MepM/ murein hydrolase activator NlpD
MNFIVENLELYNQLYKSHLELAQNMKRRFDFTPSISPLYGTRMSRYGWRTHPILGSFRFHKGIDISASTGAPIRCTANGVVEFAGVSGAFGNVVVVQHGYGYRTVYAHCSRLLVNHGDSVKKGQVIALVGSTGMSTGPHLHYEVRKWQNSLNPQQFLNLDMFTARDRVW